MSLLNRAPETSGSEYNNQEYLQAETSAPTSDVTFARPHPRDAAAVHALIEVCKPLDLNSTYAYLLLCHHYRDTCVVARDADGLIGFISGYLLPGDPQTLFVWQVAVHPRARGRRLGGHMLAQLITRSSAPATRYLETTVSPSNEASRRMFQRFAEEIGAPIGQRMLFDRDAFGTEDHEEEILLQIGPFNAAGL